MFQGRISNYEYNFLFVHISVLNGILPFDMSYAY